MIKTPLGDLSEDNVNWLLGNAKSFETEAKPPYMKYDKSDRYDNYILLGHKDDNGVPKFSDLVDRMRCAIFRASSAPKINNKMLILSSDDVITFIRLNRFGKLKLNYSDYKHEHSGSKGRTSTKLAKYA